MKPGVSRERPGNRCWALAADLAKATVAGERGDLDTANELADAAETELLPIGAQAMLSLVQFVRGRYAVAHQLYSDGYEHLSRVIDPSDIAYHPFVGYWAMADLIEAAAHAGKAEEAKGLLGCLEAAAERDVGVVPEGHRRLLQTDTGQER